MARLHGAICLALTLLPSIALAQDDAVAFDASETRVTGYYSVSPSIQYVNIPNFVLDSFFSKSTGMWEGGATNLSYGLTWAYARPEKYEISVSMQQTSMATGDGYWLEAGDRVEEADWTTNNLSTLGLETKFQWLNALSGDGKTQISTGFGLGVATVSGKFMKYDVNPVRCGAGLSNAERLSTNAVILDGCFNEDGSPALIEDNGKPIGVEEDKIPPVLPILSLNIGIRQAISDNGLLSLDMGMRAPHGLFVGLSAGYQWPEGR